MPPKAVVSVITAIMLWCVCTGEIRAEKGETDTMTETTFNVFFPVAAKNRSRTYVEAKNAILATSGKERKKTMTALKAITKHKDDVDWEMYLTARILAGWMENVNDYARFGALSRGELPGPKPLSGFSIEHRAGAMAALNDPAPRVLEMVYKNREYADEKAEASLFASLIRINDPIAVMPMIALLNDKESAVFTRMSTLNVLSHFGDEKSLEEVIRVANNHYEADAVRHTAIRSLSGFKQPEASKALVKILTNSAKPEQDREAASSGLLMMGNPATRQSVKEAIPMTVEPMIKINLISTLGRIGTQEDLSYLNLLSNDPNRDISEAAKDAIEEISSRQQE